MLENEYFKNKFRINSSRLANWDYGDDGYYFVTICTKDRICYFGDVADYKMILNRVGYIAKNYWRQIPKHFEHVKLDAFIVMPNHIHGIIVINKNKIINDEMPFIGFNNNENGRGCGRYYDGRDEALPRLYDDDHNHDGNNISPKPGSLPVIIGSFKSIVAKSIHKLNVDFCWQARYHDHIIRDQISLFKIRHYIQDNPRKWQDDRNFKKNN